MQLRRELGVSDLFLLNVVGIVGLRWIAKAAAPPGGMSSLGLWGLAFLLFFVPQAITVMELSARFPDEGGIYAWTRRAFGPGHGFLCGWCYWTNNLVYFPSLLMYIAGNAAFMAGASGQYLSESRLFIASAALLLLWIGVILHIRGLRSGKWVHNIGAFGTWLPAMVLIGCGAAAFLRTGTANRFQPAQMIPRLTDMPSLTFWSAICFAFAGLELGPLMAGEVRNPRRVLPRAIITSGVVITLIYILGTGSLLAIIPEGQVSRITGVVQAIDAAGNTVGLSGLGPFIAFCVTLGGLGGLAAWIGGTARVPFAAGVDRYLPAAFGKLHSRYGTPWLALLIPGILSTLFLLMSLVGTDVEKAYEVLLNSTIILYFIPYLYLFASLFVLCRADRKNDDPGFLRMGPAVTRLVGAVGFLVTLLAVLLAFHPEGAGVKPEEVGGYLGMLFGICGLFIGTGLLVYFRRRGNAGVTDRPL